MTTPRVTVPVDGAEVTITLTGKVSDTMPDRPGWFRVTGHKFIFSATGDDAAIQLSAAPAPEGGAARQSIIDFDVEEYVDGYEFRGDEGGYTPTDDERALITDAIHGVLSELSIDTREEPPAEAGDYQVGEFIGRQSVLCRHGSTDPNNLCDYCEGDKVWPGRAQPPAREGGVK